MKTQRSKESYLLMDNRAGPGLPGVPQFLEAATFTCSHCQRIVFINPQRTRERAFCRKCDHYLCDECGIVAQQSLIHKPFAQVLDEAQELAEKGLPVPTFTRDHHG